MNDPTRTLKNPANRLPDLKLAEAGADTSRSIRGSGRGSPLLLLLHDGGCQECREYLERIDGLGQDLSDWDGEPMIVRSGAAVEAGPDDPYAGIRVLHDDEGQLAARLGVAVPAVVIADRWGEIRLLHPAGDQHVFPDPAEIVEWLRFVAIECPECMGESF